MNDKKGINQPPIDNPLTSPLKPNLLIVLGGHVSEKRKVEARLNQKPRIDEVELESRFNIPLYDFDWLDQQTSKDRLTPYLMKIHQNQSNWLALRAFLALENIDVMYATGEDIGLPLAILLRLTRKKRPLLIMRLEQPMYGRTRWRRWLYNIYYRLAMARIDLTMCRTYSHVRLLQSWGITEDRITFVPETTDSTFFNPDSPITSFDSFELPSKPYIVSAGLEMRDYDTLVKAIDGLPVQVIIGAGSPWSKFRYDREETLPQNVSVSTFTPLQMRELYRFAECVVVPVKPTLRSCGITVVLEAWGMQKPVIASRTEGLTTYIEDGKTGLFVEPQNTKELREKILYTLSHPEEARKWGLNGWQRVITELNLECYLNEILSAASGLMNKV